jgi:hypothetical protein
MARELVQVSRSKGRHVRFVASAVEGLPLEPGVSEPREVSGIDAALLFDRDASSLSKRLLNYLDLDRGLIVAPLTEHHFQSRPLFLISIPKSGTHLLYELAGAFGYAAGIVCPDNPCGGHWYCVEYSNSHTVARDFFVDTVRRSPFGNRHHPFPRCPALFIYRNPVDIVVSEANYYHRDGASAFAGYLAGKSFEDRLLRLIDDPWLLGSIRDRIGGFIPWLDFPNVIPVSFEELIGINGGGSAEAQKKLIWSIQLKLHVPGDPEDFGNRVFNRESATFHAGRIGSGNRGLSSKALAKFESLPRDFMDAFGYSAIDPLPSRREEFRRRPLAVSEADFDQTPITIITDFLDHNVIKFKGRYYAVPQSAGPLDIEEALMQSPKRFLSSRDLNKIKRLLIVTDQSISQFDPREDRTPPRLEKSLPLHNIVSFQGNFYIIPKSLGPIDLEQPEVAENPELRKTHSLADAIFLAERLEST